MIELEEQAEKAKRAKEALKEAIEEAEHGENLGVFLDLVAYAEIGEPLLDVSSNGYDVLVGSTAENPHLFHDYSTHPLPKATDAIDLGGGLKSTAAGRYQFLSRDWLHYKNQLGLPDFGPASQDLWAMQLIKERGALDDVVEGRIEDAIVKCNNIWASLPGNSYGQPQKAMAELLKKFESMGGTLA